MKKAKIAELKNRLSYYLRFVRRGQSVLVYDRDRPIARIDPVAAASSEDVGDWTVELERIGTVRPPTAPLSADWLRQRVQVTSDVVGALLEERASGR